MTLWDGYGLFYPDLELLHDDIYKKVLLVHMLGHVNPVCIVVPYFIRFRSEPLLGCLQLWLHWNCILKNMSQLNYSLNFDVLLTMHLSITLANDQLDAQIFNTFITLLYMYMFWAISCSSSGGQIVLIQHLVSSLSVSDLSVHGLRKNCTVTYWKRRYQMLC
jgi:hypothetical protein